MGSGVNQWAVLWQYWIYMLASKVFVFLFLWWIKKQNSCSKATPVSHRYGEDNSIDFSANVLYHHVYQFHMKQCISMSPTPNYLPEGMKLLEVEGKNIFRLCLFFFCMDLANSYLKVWYNVGLQFKVMLLHVELSSVRPLVRNRSMWMYRLEVWCLGSDLVTPHFHTSQPTEI